jgi:hypothetical protein
LFRLRDLVARGRLQFLGHQVTIAVHSDSERRIGFDGKSRCLIIFHWQKGEEVDPQSVKPLKSM